MDYKKLLLLLACSLVYGTSFAQLKPILFGGVDYYRNTSFVSNAHANVHVGAQLFKWRFVAPEIGFEYHFGSPNDREELNSQDPNARPPYKLETHFSSINFSLAPKIIMGNEEAAVVLLPQYNIGKVTAQANLLKDSGRDYRVDAQQKISNPIGFWSFAAGVEGQFWDSEFLSFGLLLKYSLLDSGETFDQIDIGEPGLSAPAGSADGLGVSFRIYFDLIGLLK